MLSICYTGIVAHILDETGPESEQREYGIGYLVGERVGTPMYFVMVLQRIYPVLFKASFDEFESGKTKSQKDIELDLLENHLSNGESILFSSMTEEVKNKIIGGGLDVQVTKNLEFMKSVLAILEESHAGKQGNILDMLL